MEAITVSIQNLLEGSQGASLKASKIVLAGLPLSGYKDQLLQDNLAACQKARTKTDFAKHLSLALTCLNNSLSVADKGIEDQCEQSTDTRELDDLALSIREELASAQKSFLVVGKLLKQANETLKIDGKKQADFVAWAKDNCGILKAQAYKLMKVYETFGDESDFAGVSMRVLYTLTSQNDEIVEKARELAKEGKLDTNALDALLDKPAPAPASNRTSGGPGTSGTSAPQGQTAKTANELKLEKRIADLERENAIMKDQDKLDEKDTNNQLAQYQKTIQELNKTIEALRRQLEEAESKKKQPINTVPFLPQFNSANPCTVLGLEPEKADDANEVNKAFRALAKIYTAVSCREGSLAISNARQKLLK